MLNLLYAFLSVIAVKFAINFANYTQCKRYLSRYKRYVKEPEWKFVEHKQQILKLFKGAGITDSTVATVEPIGFGYIRSGNASVQQNLTNTREDVVGLSINMFHQAIGVYRSRMMEAFNPLYWVEFIVNLPKQLLGYLGVEPGSIVIKLAQLLYWAIGAIIIFILGLFSQEIETLVKSWLTRLSP